MLTKHAYVPTLILPDGTALDHWQYIPSDGASGTRWDSEPIHLATDRSAFADVELADPYATACLLLAHTFVRHGMPQDQYGQHYAVTLAPADGPRAEVRGSEQAVGLMWIDLLAGCSHREPWTVDLGPERLGYALEQHTQRQAALGSAPRN